MFVILQNVEHKPYAEEECKIMLVEPKGVVNTGQEKTEQTAENDVWISILIEIALIQGEIIKLFML